MVKEFVYQVIQDIFEEKELVILEMNGEADHIHILFEADLFTAPGKLVSWKCIVYYFDIIRSGSIGEGKNINFLCAVRNRKGFVNGIDAIIKL